MTLQDRIGDVTERIVKRSHDSRSAYLDRIRGAAERGPQRSRLSCGNLAHGFAACGLSDKAALSGDVVPNLGIITAYNDMLSAHQPFETFPDLIKPGGAEAGGVAQVAGGVPAMCDGVTQGQEGMELSLFSRDVIAMAAGSACRTTCSTPLSISASATRSCRALIIAALTFGHLPAVFIPAGPMTTGMPNDEKAKVRQLYAEGKVGRDELLESESASYHGPGTCTFYGTANSNQMLMEIMGLHLPGASLRQSGHAAARCADEGSGEARAGDHRARQRVHAGRRDHRRAAIVNGVVGLHATGGSTNHTIHLIAMAARGRDQADLGTFPTCPKPFPLLARVYPNGKADVNHFHAAGGLGFLIRELLDAGCCTRTCARSSATDWPATPWKPKLDAR
jgi:phosphogluconate dehydratase